MNDIEVIHAQEIKIVSFATGDENKRMQKNTKVLWWIRDKFKILL